MTPRYVFGFMKGLGNISYRNRQTLSPPQGCRSQSILERTIVNASRTSSILPPEQQNVILVDAATLREAERLIETCEACNPEGAQIPFDNVLDRRYRIRSERDGLHSRDAGEGSNCRRAVVEKTLVEPA
jgi:hypothetical protein